MDDVDVFVYDDDTLLGWIAWITMFVNPWGQTNDYEDWKASVYASLIHEGFDPNMKMEEFKRVFNDNSTAN